MAIQPLLAGRRQFGWWVGSTLFFSGTAGRAQSDSYAVEQPSDVTLLAAEASDLVYSFGQNSRLRLVRSTNERIGILKADYPDGSRAAVYQDNFGRYYVAYAGTDPSGGAQTSSDLQADAIFLGRIPIVQAAPSILGQSQLQAALSFAQVAKIALERIGVSPSNMVVTGHSLGGGLAQVVGSTILAGAETQTFNAPGVGNVLKLISPSNPLHGVIAARDDNARITNHFRIGDEVSRVGGQHFGRRVAYDNPIFSLTVPADDPSVFAKHSMSKFLGDLKGGMRGIAVDGNAQLAKLTTSDKRKLEKLNPVRMRKEHEARVGQESDCSTTLRLPEIRDNQLFVPPLFESKCAAK